MMFLGIHRHCPSSRSRKYDPNPRTMPLRLTEFGHGITAVDAEFLRPGMDASYLIIEDGRAAFVDAGTSHSVPNLLAALKEKGITVGQVDYLFLTHIVLPRVRQRSW